MTRIALTADLHWGIRTSGDDATRSLVAYLQSAPPDVLILAGDVGSGEHFAECLSLFDDLTCLKALVPGNHDIWVEADDTRGDSLVVYERYLPAHCAEQGFHYLDHAPLALPGCELALCGSINWYDYSWSLTALQASSPDWQDRLRTKRFTRGRHNDGRFVRWPCSDQSFTERVVGKLANHLDSVFQTVSRSIVVTHHPPLYGLSFPRIAPPVTLDGLLWDAFSGNRAMEDLLTRHQDRIPFVFCGHTHREREATVRSLRGFNIGGDYHFKRLLTLTWPEGVVETLVFGDPGAIGAA